MINPAAVGGARPDEWRDRGKHALSWGLGAKKDGVIRHHFARRDGSIRDTVIYSILAGEWPDVKRHLESRLAKH